MSFEEFEKAILEKGGSFEDVGRLNKEGFDAAEDAFREMWESGEMEYIKTEDDFNEWCYWIGRAFIMENLGEEPYTITRGEN